MARQKIEPLPRDEWDFIPARPLPPLWQWNDWLNYEYARSCRPLVTAVVALRAQKITEREVGSWPPSPKFPRHAIYLAHRYPGFPMTPWLKLPPDQRKIRKETGDQIGGPFEEGALEVWDTFEFANRIATGDILLDPQNVSDQKYSVLKIDFLRDKKLIEKKFRVWLKRRQTEYLQTRAAALDRLSAEAAMPPKQSKGVHSGQTKNKRNYTTAFNQLAALRLLEHCEYDTSSH